MDFSQIETKDVTLDDVWSLDLAKLDSWRCVRENTAGETAFREMGEGEDAEGSDDDDSD